MSAADPVEDRSEDRLQHFASLTDAALAHLDAEELLIELLDRVRAILHVDTAAVLLLDPNSRQLIATTARGIEEEVTQGVRIPVGRGFAGKIAAEKRPVILDRVDHTNVMNPILRERGICSLLGVPLLSGGTTIGVLHVGTLTPRAFTEADKELLQVVADRIALATQARVSDVERAAAITLQRSLLPSRLPAIAGLEFAARYVPGEAGGVGGDWYDVFTLPSEALCVVMGDVAGRGLPAAVVMGRLRSTLRSYALIVDDPAEILTLADRKLRHFEHAEMATALLAVIDPSLTSITISSAGHPTPVVIDRTAPAALMELPIDPPLGIGLAPKRRSTTVELGADVVLCLYTDGLVERRGVSLDDRFDLLCRSVELDAPEAVCASVMGRLIGADPPNDDVSLLVVRRNETDDAAPLEIDLPARPSSLRDIRAALRRWLAGVGASKGDANDIVVAVGEASANAVEHAYGAAGGTVTVRAELDGDDVVVRISDTGSWRPPRGQGRGRGTLIMQTTTDQFRVDRRVDGTDVVLRRHLTR
jgi:serine phosphatase RsbU (regulator of sigma subunit)/anti-sigma regulatory factor (Ser/Thr protein kinase)